MCTVKITRLADPCPACGLVLSRPETDQPWCPACEWNLGVYDPEMTPSRGWLWLERLSHRLAYRWDGVLFARFSAERPSAPGWTPAHIALVAVSAVLLAVPLGLLVLGILVLRDFPSWQGVLGLVPLALAYALRPRFGRVPSGKFVVRRDQVPTLFALIDQVAEAVGAATPKVVVVDLDFNAASGRTGLRRTSVLSIGAPLWAVLGPQERVALLAHELGHQVNGDPARGLLVRPALTTFAALARATGVHRTIRDITFSEDPYERVPLPVQLVLWVVSRIVLSVHFVLAALGQRDGQRSEYLADAVAVDVAGSAATVALLDNLTVLPDVVRLLVHHAETKPAGEWRAMAASLYANRQADMASLRQLSTRRTSVWDSHPPNGLRARMVEAWPHRDPVVVLTSVDSARVDAELAGRYARAHRAFLGARDYRGPR
jgi:Zn-dependent protease with chaperone function